MWVCHSRRSVLHKGKSHCIYSIHIYSMYFPSVCDVFICTVHTSTLVVEVDSFN